MYIDDWVPQVGLRHGVPVLNAQATLRCPSCDHVHHIETDGHFSYNQGSQKTPLTMQIAWITDRLLNRRDCDNCGVTSGPNQKDRETLLAEAPRRITVKWIEKEAESLKSTAA